MKNIKSYKLFLESLNNSLYKDDEYILHGLFTPLYDKYYDIQVERGCIDDNGEFQIISPGKNKRLGYSVKLIKTNKRFTEEDIGDCITNIEIDGMKVVKHKLHLDVVIFIIDALKTSDITIDDVIKELGFITKEEYLEGDAFIKEQLENSTTESNAEYKTWYNDKNEWIIQQDLKNDIFFLQKSRIWSFFGTKFGLNYEQIQLFTKLLLESNLNCQVSITITIGVGTAKDWRVT